ncbi:ModE family transcriptional regulator [Sphingopyxis sp.]|uniref:winged helix-turn-helix domain-containing protein n=1 Tax=Sphingopyxis sp. TaxID=1908224 RepID=UPI002D766547|nr:ModE family transcriptional regulator [Sphingopyxis sp.]HET6527013.1 ModE family transcriptional regulator [Sphingopyxis sp.]
MLSDRPLKIKIQILCGDEIAMGPGKADLLDAIRDHGSISAAGRALGMSYRRTWLLVDAMNRCWTERLVDTVPGGGQARGATVTRTGETILSAYRAMQAAADEAASPIMARDIERLLLPAPRPSEAGALS